jgi:hypothetical protein
MTTTVALMDTSTNPHCHSCGDASDGLVLVRRLYVMTPEPDAQSHHADNSHAAGPESDLVVTPGGEELWCGVCRIHYPHERPADPG